MNKRMAGTEGERQAAEYLEARSFRILERNFRCTQGEIDIIGVHEGYLVFVEVKYRSSDGKGSAAQAVNMKKQRRICRTADYYRYVNRLTEDTGVRYDVVAIQGKEIRWIQNAFSHIYASRSR
ncbi:MAG: YraN family protein [Lachnospiraceae bacterium]|jgi:putative endonuclease|nr:YraN family protein [Lachnospiraceae bacterium]